MAWWTETDHTNVIAKEMFSSVIPVCSQGGKIQSCRLLWSTAWLSSPWWQPDAVCGGPCGELLTASSRAALSSQTRRGADLLPWVWSCHAPDLCTGEWFLMVNLPTAFPFFFPFFCCCQISPLNEFFRTEHVEGFIGLKRPQIFLLASFFTTYLYSEVSSLIKELCWIPAYGERIDCH
jgi:hypothetical protein